MGGAQLRSMWQVVSPLGQEFSCPLQALTHQMSLKAVLRLMGNLRGRPAYPLNLQAANPYCSRICRGLQGSRNGEFVSGPCVSLHVVDAMQF